MGIGFRWGTVFESEGEIRMSCLEVLLKQANVDDYEIESSQIQSIQHFYVLDRLETVRHGQTKDTLVKVYMDQDQKRGVSSFTLDPSDTDESIVTKIEQAKANALLALNPYYPLQEPQDKMVKPNMPWDKEQLKSLATQVGSMIYGIKHHSDVWINSLEIFVNEKQTTFTNSKGVDLTNSTHWIEIELITTSKNDLNEEFELYLDVVDDHVDLETIKSKVKEIFNVTLDRAHCVDMPSTVEQYPVLIKGEMRNKLMGALLHNGLYRKIYEKRNRYNLGQTIGNDDLSIGIKASDPRVVSTNGFDGHGTVVDDRTIIDHGRLIDTYGDLVYGHYLNQDHISGTAPIMEVSYENGFDAHDLTTDYLEIVHFSSPQLIETSGYFGGEVRLAYLHHDGKVLPVTGFSISGNLYEMIKTMKASNDTVCESYREGMSYIGPSALLFEKMSIH